jgi:acetyl-CoA C-acetyltransferase
MDFKGYYLLEGHKLYANLNGGLKADGNPLGATGGAQVFEIVKQLSGEAGERQVHVEEGLQYGCSLELEGFGTKAYVHVFGRD